MLEKAKDCNKIYSEEYVRYINQTIAIVADRIPLNNIPFVIEIITSLQLLDKYHCDLDNKLHS